MMNSTLFTFHGIGSELSQTFHPPLKLKSGINYAIGLRSLVTFNSIPNITNKNNEFRVDEESFYLPIGTYEIDDIAKFINFASQGEVNLKIFLNRRNQKCKLYCNKTIDFTRPNSFAHLLGFGKVILHENEYHESKFCVDMHPVKSIFVECNLANGSYFNSKSNQNIYSFPCTVPSGFQININPHDVVYIPVTGGTDVHDIEVKIRDQEGNLINLMGESLTITLHLKPLGWE